MRNQFSSHKMRLRHLAGCIHHLGPRPLFELLVELDHGAELRSTLERYAALPAEFIHALDADKLPPLQVVAPE